MDAAAERLIHSVNAVTDLLKANAKLRDNTERVQRELEGRDAEAFQLNIENQALRERLELVEGILKNNSHDYDDLVSQQIKAIMEKSNTEYGKAGRGGQLKNIQPRVTTVDEVYTELIQLRNKNRALEGRIKQLENQNFNMSQSNFHSKEPTSAHATNSQATQRNMEPLRPQFVQFNNMISGFQSPQPNSMSNQLTEGDSGQRHQTIKRTDTTVPVHQQSSFWANQSTTNHDDDQQMMNDSSQFARHMPLLNNNGGYQSDGVMRA